jgi:hypothetical protein
LELKNQVIHQRSLPQINEVKITRSLIKVKGDKMKEYIKKQIGNIQKFSFAEMTSNSSGKTSGSGTAGLYIVFIGGLTFLVGCVDKMFLNNDIDVITQSVVLVGIGAGLLGYRKSKDNTEEPKVEEVQETTEEEING